MSSDTDSRKAERDRLMAQRKALMDRLDSIESDYRRGLDADAEERAQELENAEVLDAIARAARAELERIEGLLAEMIRSPRD